MTDDQSKVARMTEAERREAWRLADVARRGRKAALGLCAACTKPAAPGKRRCWEHLAQARERWHHRPEAAMGVGREPTGPVARLNARLAAAGRCGRCGLLLPCHACIPTAAEIASARRGGDEMPLALARVRS